MNKRVLVMVSSPLLRRLAFAKRLLRETARPVADIARAAGFSSASHLGTALRADCGVTPNQWRKSDIFPKKI